MIIGHTQPLAIAAAILKPSTIEAVRRSPSYHLVGWSILDRWALNSPRQLRELEAQGELILLGRLLEQQLVEHKTLSMSLEQRRNGMTDQEILTSNEIRTEL